jgi:hypothetical protein
MRNEILQHHLFIPPFFTALSLSLSQCITGRTDVVSETGIFSLSIVTADL